MMLYREHKTGLVSQIVGERQIIGIHLSIIARFSRATLSPLIAYVEIAEAKSKITYPRFFVNVNGLLREG
jgi:hypothetical protein